MALRNVRRSTRALSGDPYRRGGTRGQRDELYTSLGERVGPTIYSLGQRELLAARATVRSLDPDHVRHVHRCELRMELAH